MEAFGFFMGKANLGVWQASRRRNVYDHIARTKLPHHSELPFSSLLQAMPGTIHVRATTFKNGHSGEGFEKKVS